jgi:Helicase HerA-like C-terminal
MQKTFEFAGVQGKRASLNLSMANRHAIITGATDSGRTVVLHSLAEEFSRSGMPTLVTDIRGDLSGLAQSGDHQQSPLGLNSYRSMHTTIVRIRLSFGAYLAEKGIRFPSLYLIWGRCHYPVRLFFRHNPVSGH